MGAGPRTLAASRPRCRLLRISSKRAKLDEKERSSHSTPLSLLGHFVIQSGGRGGRGMQSAFLTLSIFNAAA